MSEKLLHESLLIEAEAGFDAHADQAYDVTTGTVAPKAEGDTAASDIAQTVPKTKLAKNTISKSLPYMIGYVQPLQSPTGYVFGLKSREDTSITATADDANDDPVVIRKSINTEIREVAISTTIETEQDIMSLFGTDFKKRYSDFVDSEKGYWGGSNSKLGKFFFQVSMQKMTGKINQDFATWLAATATSKGTATIASYAEMDEILGVIAELKEALHRSTGKSGPVWILVTPRIAAYLAATIGSMKNNSADVYNKGKREVQNSENGYVLTMGDIEVYQYDFNKSITEVTGGDAASAEATGEIYMGFSGGPDVSSVYYTPYKEYIIQGGEDFYTGQSTIFYRVRDFWCTNPLDTYDKALDAVVIEDSTTNPKVTNSSQYIVKADINFTTNLLV